MGTRLATSVTSCPARTPPPPDDANINARKFVTPRLLFSIIMVECPQSHKIRNSCRKTHTEWVCHAVTTSHKGSQTVTKSHQAPNPALFWESHSVTKSHQAPTPAHLWNRTQHHKVAPGPSPTAFRESHSVTKSHQAPAPALSGCHAT